MTRVIDITEDSLEDLLAYDDLFLDYFNTFLQLSVFSTPIYYDRLTGTFLEVHGGQRALSGLLSERHTSPPYGATDEERDRMLEWAREERLPVFLKSQLFREFKLCKLLLRPLEEHGSALRGGSSKIRGYSRQTETDVSSLSNSVDNSANDADLEGMEGGWQPTYTQVYLYKYRRPGSRAFSVPSFVGLGRYIDSKASNEIDTREGSFPVNNSNKSSQDVSPQDKPANFTKYTRASNNIEDAINEGETSPSKAPFKQRSNEERMELLSREVTFQMDLKETHDTAASGVTQRSKSAGSGMIRSRSGRANRRKATPGGVNILQISSNPNEDDEFGDERPVVDDYDAVYGEEEPDPNVEPLVDFGDDAVSEQQTEADAKEIEDKHHMPIQSMKEQQLSSVAGVDELKSFLSTTAGKVLLDFWLDCEYFKDTVEELDDETIKVTRLRLFRNIQDKYKLTLTPDAQRHISMAVSHDEGLSHNVFLRAQYNVLRRLRSYWLLRFLIHKEHTGGFRQPLLTIREDDSPKAEMKNVLNSLSLARSLPVKTESIRLDAENMSWDTLLKGGKHMDSRIQSAKTFQVSSSWDTGRTLQDKCAVAMSADRMCGGPLRRYLEIHRGHETAVPGLSFWEEVAAYGQEQLRVADRLLRLHHAWNIFNNFIAPHSKQFIGVASELSEQIRRKLQSSRDYVEAAVFETAQAHVVGTLEKHWVEYLKNDLKNFIDAHIQNTDGETSRIEEYEVVVDLDTEEKHLQLYVRGPRPWIRRDPPSTGSERGHRLHTAISLAETIDQTKIAERRKEIAQRRAQMEKERKKAVKAARKRLLEAKRAQLPQKAKTTQPAAEDKESVDPSAMTETGRTFNTDQHRDLDRSSKPPTFADTVKKNKAIISIFKKYVGDTLTKETKDMVNLYLDIDSYHHMDRDKTKSVAKDKQASYIYKTYLDPNSKRKVTVPEKLKSRVGLDGSRPKSGVLKDMQHHCGTSLEEAFQKFWETGYPGLEDILNRSYMVEFKSQQNVGSMSKAELAMRAEDLSVAWRGRSRRGTRADGRAQPTREDQVEFFQELQTASMGKLPLKMVYFYKHIVKYTEEDPAFNIPLENDLFFWLEVQKFKDNCHAHADEELLVRKVQSILNCYLEATTPPSIQVNISYEVSQKASRAATKYIQGKDVAATIFDDAQLQAFRNLLPYWAGFIKSYKKPTDHSMPLTKKQRERQQRLEQIMNLASRPATGGQLQLPPLPRGLTVGALSYTMSDGLRWKEGFDETLDITEDVVDNEASFENPDDEMAHVGSTLGPSRANTKIRKNSHMTQEVSQMSIKIK